MNLKLSYRIDVVNKGFITGGVEQVFTPMKNEGYFLHGEEPRDEAVYGPMAEYAARCFADDLQHIINKQHTNDAHVVTVSGIDLTDVKKSYLFRDSAPYTIVELAMGEHDMKLGNSELQKAIENIAKSYVRQVFYTAVRYVEDFKRV